ncbi:MAG: HAD-IB family hydrolase [Litorimonas sp.]
MPNIAIFDLDYTLTKRGTWGRFVFLNVRSRPWLWLPLLFTAAWHQWRYKKGFIPRIAVKTSMMKWSMAGKPRIEMLKIAQKFASDEVPNKLLPGAIRALDMHKKAGDTIIIASAAVCVVVDMIAQELDVKYWVATNMTWENDRLGSGFASKNCYGPEKLQRVLQLLDENPALKHSDTLITFYSDSYSDIEMFTFCDIGKAVNPDSKLRATAESSGIEIVDWNT